MPAQYQRAHSSATKIETVPVQITVMRRTITCRIRVTPGPRIDLNSMRSTSIVAHGASVSVSLAASLVLSGQAQAVFYVTFQLALIQSIDWLIDFLIICSIDWLIDWLVDQFPLVFSADRLIDWLIDNKLVFR